MKILLLEDDLILSDLITEYLEKLGYEITKCYDGLKANALIEKEKFDLFLFDVGVPNLSGFELLEYLRDIKITTPTIFITSLNSSKDMEIGFGLGCDDYIKKPFDLKELELRIENIKKSHHIQLQNQESLKDGYSYDKKSRSITYDGNKVELSKKEAEVLEYFIKNSKRVISLEEIVANVWNFEEEPSYATIRTYIKNLRRALPPKSITTLKGLGYKFES